jgi:hypothetical protein
LVPLKKNLCGKNTASIFATTFQNNILLYRGSYKKIIAFLLLAVYCLVAIPASALHSHAKKTGVKAAISFSNNANDEASLSADTGTDSVCKICAHQFQLHSDDSDTALLTRINFFTTENGFLNCLIPQLSLHSNFNKGPPALI